ISPSNVLLSFRGDVKLSDFGVARAEFRENKTQAGMLKGKYGYMAPEQVLGRAIDRRADLFTCGIVLAEFCTGRRLFPGRGELEVLLRIRDVKLDVLERHGAHIPQELMRLLKRSLVRDVNARFTDAAQFHDSLGQFLYERGDRVKAAKIAALLREL